jgi:hypothetical protein
MAVVRVKPADLDVVIANAVAARTGRPTSHVARALTSRADEHVLRALAFGWWLYAKSRDANPPRQRSRPAHNLDRFRAAARAKSAYSINSDRTGSRCAGIFTASRYRGCVWTLSRPDTLSTSAPWRPQQPCYRPLSEILSGPSGAVLS